MHVTKTFFIFAFLIHKTYATCVATFIDGFYPLYSKQECAIESSPINAATEHLCSRFNCNNASWVAPCSNNETVTKNECLSGYCEQTYASTCYDDRFLLSPIYYAGTCSISAYDGPQGTKSACTGIGGVWTWPNSLEACKNFAVSKHYSYFSWHPYHASLKGHILFTRCCLTCGCNAVS